MDAAHIHLLLNHVPVLGSVFAAILLSVGLLRDDESWQRIALWTLIVTGVAGVVVYLTGEPAEELVEGTVGFSHDALERHEEIAAWAMYAGGAAGAAALGTLAWFRSRALPRSLVTGILVLTLALVGVMAWTANSGGKVSHPELRGETATAVDQGDAAGEAGPGAHLERLADLRVDLHPGVLRTLAGREERRATSAETDSCGRASPADGGLDAMTLGKAAALDDG